MAADQRRPLRPLRVNAPGDRLGKPHNLPRVPELAPTRALAPDWVSPTEGNGAGLPRADLHIALVAANEDAAELAKRGLTIVAPPFFKGRVHLHVLVNRKGLSDDSIYIRQAMVDLGWADSRDVEIGPPDSITLGYPSGTDE